MTPTTSPTITLTLNNFLPSYLYISNNITSNLYVIMHFLHLIFAVNVSNSTLFFMTPSTIPTNNPTYYLVNYNTDM